MYLFTSEVVSPGHPDKCADIIADSIVDAHIMADTSLKVGIERFVKWYREFYNKVDKRI